MPTPTIQTKDLSRDFGQVKALDGLTLSVNEGTILTLLGPNGAGKTTLLRLLMGLLDPTRGQAEVLGTSSRRLGAGVAGRVAYVADRCEPPHWATAATLEDLQANASPSFDRALFGDYCARRGLPRHQPYGSLSRGQRRWMLTSLALAARPQVILLDEPAAGLDPAARKALYDAIRDHVSTGDVTAIVTTHIIGDVERVADDVAILNAGQLRLHATLEDLRDRVRQVEIPADERSMGAPPVLCVEQALGKAVAVLGTMRSGTTDIVWIQRNGMSDAEVLRRLGSGATIRHVGLEALYLAVAEQRTVTTTPDDEPNVDMDLPSGVAERSWRQECSATPNGRATSTTFFAQREPSDPKTQPHHKNARTPSLRWGLLKFLWRRTLPVTALCTLGLTLFALLWPFVLAADNLWPAGIILAHCVLLAGTFGRFASPPFAFTYSRGYSRDAVWTRMMLVSGLSALTAWLTTGLVLWTGLRSGLHDLLKSPNFPVMSPLETPVPLIWLGLYVLLVPAGHYVWIRQAQPTRGRHGGGFVAVALLAALLAGVYLFHVDGGWFAWLGGVLYVVVTVCLIIGGRALHRSVEVRV